MERFIQEYYVGLHELIPNPYLLLLTHLLGIRRTNTCSHLLVQSRRLLKLRDLVTHEFMGWLALLRLQSRILLPRWGMWHLNLLEKVTLSSFTLSRPDSLSVPQVSSLGLILLPTRNVSTIVCWSVLRTSTNNRKSRSFFCGGIGKTLCYSVDRKLTVTDVQTHLPELFLCTTCSYQR